MSVTMRPRTKPAHSGPQEHVVVVDGTRIRYLEVGAQYSGIPLIMLHGYRGGADYWLPHPLLDLSGERHVIAPDLPGYGRSGTMPAYSMDAYAQIINDFAKTLGYGS